LCKEGCPFEEGIDRRDEEEGDKEERINHYGQEPIGDMVRNERLRELIKLSVDETKYVETNDIPYYLHCSESGCQRVETKGNGDKE